MPTGGPRPKYHESLRKAVEDLLRAGVGVNNLADDLHIKSPQRKSQWDYLSNVRSKLSHLASPRTKLSISSAVTAAMTWFRR